MAEGFFDKADYAKGSSDNADAFNKKLADEGPLARTAQRGAEFRGEQKKLAANLHSGSDMVRETLRGQEAEAKALTPPKLETVPPPTPKKTDPAEIWGSLAMVMAGLGALATRNHLTTALNAASGVMNAFHKGDLEAATAAHDTWKASNENAIKVAQFQMDTYKNALSSIERRERITLGEGTLQEREANAAIIAHAKAFQDENTALIAQQRGLAEVVRHIDRQDAAISKFKTASEKADREGNKVKQALGLKQAWTDFTQTPQYQAMSVPEKTKAYFKMASEIAPLHDNRGDGSKKDIQAAQMVYKAQYVPGGNPIKGSPTFDQFYKSQWKNWGKEAPDKPLLSAADLQSRGAKPPEKPGAAPKKEDEALPKHDLFGGGEPEHAPTPAGPAGAPSAPAAGAAVAVKTPAEAQKLAPGTRYRTPDGTEYVR